MKELTNFERAILNLVHKFMWDIVKEKVLEELEDDCPNRESCEEAAIENYEPMHNEGYD